MNINWKEIKEKYPKGYEKLVKHLEKFYSDFYGEYRKISIDETLHIESSCDHDYRDICYCDLEKFFDEHGIIINVFYDNNYFEKYIKIDVNNYRKIYRNVLDNRNEAKLKAVKKAFEILETTL